MSEKNISQEEIEQIFGVDATAEATADEKLTFYSYLGILATTFAEIETRLQDLIGTMEGLHFIGYKLLEGNSLEKNLQLLSSLSQFRHFKVNEIKEFINGLSKIKTDRNNLIHGNWEIFQDKSLQPVVSVRSSRIRITNINDIKSWQKGSQRIYTIEEMRNLIETAKKLCENLKDILAAQISKNHPGSEWWIRKALK